MCLSCTLLQVVSLCTHRLPFHNRVLCCCTICSYRCSDNRCNCLIHFCLLQSITVGNFLSCGQFQCWNLVQPLYAELWFWPQLAHLSWSWLTVHSPYLCDWAHRGHRGWYALHAAALCPYRWLLLQRTGNGIYVDTLCYVNVMLTTFFSSPSYPIMTAKLGINPSSVRFVILRLHLDIVKWTPAMTPFAHPLYSRRLDVARGLKIPMILRIFNREERSRTKTC